MTISEGPQSNLLTGEVVVFCNLGYVWKFFFQIYLTTLFVESRISKNGANTAEVMGKLGRSEARYLKHFVNLARPLFFFVKNTK